MENVNGYTVERDGNLIRISLFDVFGMGETYTFTLEDARKIMLSIEQMLGPQDPDVLYNDLC